MRRAAGFLSTGPRASPRLTLPPSHPGHSFNQLKLMKRPRKPTKRSADGSVEPHGVVLQPRRAPGRRRALEHPTTSASLLQQARAARQSGMAEPSPSPVLGSPSPHSTAHVAMATQGASPGGLAAGSRHGAAAQGAAAAAAADGAGGGDDDDDPADDSGGARIPHNACINAGAIVCCSLLRPQDSLSERVEYVVDAWERLCGSAVSIDSSLFLSERATADRNFALAYLLREMGAFPRGADNLNDTLELYFQQCSIQMCTRQMARVAAALANGGLNPLTSERVFDPLTVRHRCCRAVPADARAADPCPPRRRSSTCCPRWRWPGARAVRRGGRAAPNTHPSRPPPPCAPGPRGGGAHRVAPAECTTTAACGRSKSEFRPSLVSAAAFSP